MGRQVLVTKIVKGGFGRKINSELGFSSFEIASTSIEVHVDPPFDLTTDEGKEGFKKFNENLSKLAMKTMEDDVAFYRSRNEELDLSLSAKEKKVQRAKEEMG